MTEQNSHPFIMNNQRANVEVETYRSIAEEATYLYGTDVIYVERSFAVKEEVFGDFLSKVATKGTPMRLFVEQTEQFEGPDMFTKFGLSFQDECTIHGPKVTFQDKNILPKHGDLIYHVPSEKLFEINHVQDDKDGAVFYPLGLNFAYKLTCKLYQHDFSDMSAVEDFPELAALDDENTDDIEKNDNVQVVGTAFIDKTETDPINE